MKDVVAAHVHPAQVREVLSYAVAEVNRLRPWLEQSGTDNADAPEDNGTSPGPATGGGHDG